MPRGRRGRGKHEGATTAWIALYRRRVPVAFRYQATRPFQSFPTRFPLDRVTILENCVSGHRTPAAAGRSSIPWSGCSRSKPAAADSTARSEPSKSRNRYVFVSMSNQKIDMLWPPSDFRELSSQKAPVKDSQRSPRTSPPGPAEAGVASSSRPRFRATYRQF